MISVRSSALGLCAALVVLAGCGQPEAPKTQPPPAIDVSTATLPEGTVGAAYSAKLNSSGGKDPLSHTATGLPAGLSMATDGTVSGTPTADGDFSVVVTITDGANQTATGTYPLKIFPAPSFTTAAALPGATTGSDYATDIAVAGGKSPVTVAVTGGEVPGGLTFDAPTLKLSGIPAAAGNGSFTLTATDKNGSSSSKTFTLAIAPALTLVTQSLPDGNVGRAYTTTLQSQGGKSPVTFEVVSGVLPAGLSLDAASGALTGTPTAAGPFTVTLGAHDANGALVSQSFTAKIYANLPPSIATTTLPNAVVGQGYSQNLTAADGSPPYVWTVSSGALNAGLSLAQSGAITGSATASGPASFQVTVTDANGQSASKALTLTAYPELIIGTSSLPESYVGSAYTAQLSASGGQTPYTWIVVGGALPTGITLTSSGILSGTPSTAGSFGVTIGVTDASGQTPNKAFTVTLYSLPTLTTASLADGVVGVNYSQPVAASGGKAPLTYAVTAGALPAGLSLVGNTIAGTPSTSANATLVLTVTDANGKTDSKTLTLNVFQSLTITSASTLADAYVGASYSQTLNAAGGSSPYTWSLQSGTLPAGLTLASDGTISGSATTAGSSTFTVKVTSANNATATKTITLVVRTQPTISTPSLADGYVGQAYSATLAATGGKSPFTWSVTGSLPAGLTLSTSGVLSGTPTASGTSSVTITVTDANGETDTVQRSIAVFSPPSITTTSLADGYVGTGYTATLALSGGKAPIVFTLANGTLPNGVTLSSAGALSGTPTVAGTASLTFLATDANGKTSQAALSLAVFAPPSVATTSLPDGTKSVAYSATLQANGGKSPLTWTLSAGTLPSGITLASNGGLSGTPVNAGTNTFSLVVTDSNGVTASASLSIVVYASLTVSSASPLPDGYANVAYAQTLQAAGGKSPYTWALTAGALPTGVTLGSNGALSGTSGVSGTANFTVTVTDANNSTASKPLSLNIVPTPSITTASLRDGYVGLAYSDQVAGQNGRPPYTFTVSTGALPAGVSLDSSTGALSGAPTTKANYTFEITLTDSNNLISKKTFTVGIYDAPQVTTTSPLPDAYLGTASLVSFAGSGGKTPYTWALASGTLPPGLSLATTGDLTGTPTASGTFAFSIKLTDANGQLATKSFTEVVRDALVLTAASLTDGYVGATYPTTSLQATGGKSPYTYALSGGALPAGITLASNGSLSGTPTAAAVSSFTVTVTDANNVTANHTYGLTVYAAPSITTSAVSDSYASSAYNQALTATGGKPTLSWTISSGSLPPGLTLSTGGVISGTTTSTGPFPFSVTVTDGNQVTATRSFTLTALQALSIPTVSLSDAYVGTAYASSLSGAGGKTPYTYSVTGGTLPNGITLTGATLSGNPTAAGTANLTFTITDGNGRTATKALNLVVYAPPTISTTTLPDGYSGGSYSAQINTAGGKSPFVFSVSGGALPAGITLSSGGALSGTPTSVGNSTFTVLATDANGVTATQNLAIVVLQPLQVTTSSLADGYTGSAYSKTLAATGGKTTYTWSLASGSTLPPGLSLSTGGVVSGTPTSAAAYTFVAKVTDANGVSATGTVAVEILSPPTISTTTLADGYPSTAYSATVSTTGGRSPFTFTVGTGLPAGVTLSSGGVLSGTPTTPNTYSFTVTATDNNGVATSKLLQIIVRDPVQITTTTLVDGYLGNPYSDSFAGTGGKNPLTWSISSGALPTGLTFAAGTGAISGTPTVANTFSFTVRVTDGNGVTAQKALSIATFAVPSVTSSATLPDAYRNSAYSQTLTSTGGKAPLSWSVLSGSLPTGVTLSSGGVLSGTPTVSGATSFTVKVQDANGQAGTKLLNLNVLDGFFITTSTLADPYQGQSYSQTLAASGGLSPYAWTLASGSVLPAGLTLSSAGVISGTPTGTGSATFSIVATDSNNTTTTKSFTVTGRTPPTVTTTTLPDAYVGSAFNQTLSGSGGAPSYTWSVAPALPSGLSLTASTGAITGTPTAAAAAASYTFTLTDSNGKTATQAITFAVYAPPTVSVPAPADAYVGTAYSITPAVTGGKAAITWSTTGTVPAGLSVSSATGAITGTPTTAGAASFTLTATDANGRADSKTVAFTIYTTPSVVTAAPLATGYLTVAYQQDITATGGKTPYTWNTTGTLPPGITGSTVSNALHLSGTPTSSGTFNFTANLTDANGKPASKSFSITVAPALSISTGSLPDAYQTTAYTATMNATGGKAPYSFDIASGALPTGLTLAASGAISGTTDPAATGTTAVIRVTDANGTTATQSYNVVVYSLPSITTNSFVDGYVGAAYSATAQGSGGKGSLTWSVSAGSLPTGLNLNAATGAITGTPTAATAGSFTLSVTDANGKVASKALAIPVYVQPSINAMTFTDAYAGSAYSRTLTASGGKSPFSWNITSGGLPPGLTLDSTSGTIGTTVASSGFTNGQAFTFTVTLSDANGRTASTPYTVTAYLHVVIGATTLQTAIEGVTYLAAGGVPVTLQISNGKPPYTINAFGLPAGLSVSSTTGVVSGIPNQGTAGGYQFPVSVNDSNGDSTSKQVLVDAVAPSPIRGGGTRSVAPTGSPITDQVTVFVIGSDDLPRSGVGVRLRKNGAEFSPAKQVLTDSSGKAWFSGLGLNGTSDTLDVTVNGQTISNTAITSINSALVTLPVQDYPLPGKRREASAVFEPTSGKLLLFGGEMLGQSSPSMLQNSCPTNVIELTTPNSASWTELTPPGMSTTPPGWFGAATLLMNGRLMMVGGYSCSTGMASNTAYFMDPTTHVFTAMPVPPGQSGTEGVFVQLSPTQAVLYGGDQGGGVTSNAMMWDSNTQFWNGAPQNAPVTPRRRAAGIYRSSQNTAWICGGTNGTTALSDCFGVQSGGFNNLFFQTGLASLPAAREGLAMAYNPATDTLYAFGGRDTTGAYTSSLYTLTGAGSWTPVSPATNPPGRAGHSLVWDSVNSRLILYGGQNLTGDLDDVWTYESGNWTRRSPAPGSLNTYAISGAITGGALPPAGTSSMAYVGVTTSSGLRLSASVALSSGSGSYMINGIPSGDTITLTAANRIEQGTPDYRSVIDFGTLGPITSSTTQNIAFPTGLTNTSFSGSLTRPTGWTANPFFLPSLARPNYPIFALQNGVAAAGTPPTAFNGTYTAAGTGLSQDLLITGTDQNAATCESSTLFSYGIGAGALGSFTLPTGPRSRTPGATECSTFGTGLQQTGGSTLPTNAGADVALGDFTGDGTIDVAVLMNAAPNATVAVFSNVGGSGTSFTLTGITTVSPGATSIAAVDFNKDGKVDIAVAETNNNRVAIYISDGSGAFAPIGPTVSIPSPTRVRAADMNGDGNPDILATSTTTSALSVSFGNGSTTLTSPPAAYTVPGSDPRGFRIADLNGDGFPDVAVALHGMPQVKIYNGSSNGTLSNGVILNSPSGALIDLTVADFDNDTRPDIVAVSDINNMGGFWRQTAPGSFSSSGMPPMSGAVRVDSADLNGDGLKDIVVAEQSSGQTNVYTYQGGTFNLSQPFSVGQPIAVATADFSGDGKADMTSLTNGTVWYFNQLSQIPTVADSSFGFSAPANTAMVTLKRGAAYQTVDWVLYGPAAAGNNTFTLPLTSTLAPARNSPSGQLSMWSASLTINGATPINRNELTSRLLRPSASANSGGMLYRRQ